MREAVEKVLLPKTQQQYTGKSMYIVPFLARLNVVTIPFKVINVLVEDTAVKTPKDSYITAQWLPTRSTRVATYTEARPRRPVDIHIEWHVHPQGHRCGITPSDWKWRHFYFWAYLMHELTHRHQYGGRSKDAAKIVFPPMETEDAEIRDQQSYLGDYDEVEAYAHDIALEMTVWFPTMRYREAFAQMLNIDSKLIAATYPIFAEAFVKVPEHPAMRTLQKKIREWYDIMNTRRDIYQTLQLEPL
jgi:hypothetical protein